MTEWFHDESFWEQTYPFMFPEWRFASAERDVEQMLALVRLNGTRALDLCCGPGRHTIELAKRGFSVTAVDRSAFLMEKAKQQASEADVTVEWVIEDMRSFVRPDTYDLALSMFTSFGYFDDDENLSVLRHLRQNLKPGGTLLVDLLGKEQIAKTFKPESVQELHDGSVFVERREILDDWTKIRNEWILIQNRQATFYHFQLTMFSGRELRDLLHEAGFPTVNLYGGLDGRPYDVDAKRLVAVATK